MSNVLYYALLFLFFGDGFHSFYHVRRDDESGLSMTIGRPVSSFEPVPKRLLIIPGVLLILLVVAGVFSVFAIVA